MFLLAVVLGLLQIDLIQGQGCGCRPMGKRSAKMSNQTHNGDVVQGDMLLGPRDLAVMAGFRAAVGKEWLWAGGMVNYVFDRGVNNNLRNLIRNSLAELQRETNNCVRFQEQNSYNGPHVRVDAMNRCWSKIGRVSNGAQQLSLGGGNCFFSGVVKHEFMHALGFYHEQSRNDRDQHVTINWNRILSTECYNFEICRGCSTSTPYEIGSIMHYHSGLFSCNGNAITTRAGAYIPFQNSLTKLDVLKIKNLYGCPK